MRAVFAGLGIAMILSGQDLSAPHAVWAPGARTRSNTLAEADADERIQAHERALRASPNDLKSQAALIAAYLDKLRETADGSYLDRASKLVDRILEKDGGNFAALRFQNEIDLQRHEFKTVAERSRSMAKYAPSDPGNWGNLGDALMELGDYEGAQQAYARMFALRANLPSYNRLAYLHFVTGDAAGAIAFMRLAIEAGAATRENVAWCSAELGDMYFKTGKLDQAEDAYRSALDMFPTMHRALAGLGRVQAARGSVAEAIRSLERAQAIVPLIEYASALEDLYLERSENAKAEEQRRLIETIDKLATARKERTNRNLALILADHNRELERALRLIEAEVPNRGDVYTWDALAWVLFRSGRYQEAQAASAKALRFNTPEPSFFYHAAKIAEAIGDREEARNCAARMRSLNPRFDVKKADLELY